MRNGIEVKVKVLPKCDFCGDTAEYDAKTENGSWANMCGDCWMEHRFFPNLGVGMGQRLILEE